MTRTILLIAIALSTCCSVFAQDIKTVTIVDAVWAAPGLRFARVHHPGQRAADADIIVCEMKRHDCQPLRVGKTYPAALIDNDTPEAYPYHKKIEQVFKDETCTSVVYRTLVIVTDEVGEKIREVVPAYGDTKVPLYYGILVTPPGSDSSCRPNRK